MKANMGSADRILRVFAAAVLIILYGTKVISGSIGIAGLVIAGIFLLTSLIGFCPLYKLFGFNTCRRQQV